MTEHEGHTDQAEDPAIQARAERVAQIILGMSPEERGVIDESRAAFGTIAEAWMKAELRAKRTVGGLITEAMRALFQVGIDNPANEKVMYALGLLSDAHSMLGGYHEDNADPTPFPWEEPDPFK